LGCLGITAVVGLVLGIVSLIKIRNSQGRLGGQGYAIGGICVSAVMLFLAIPMTAMVAGMTLPALAKAKSKAQTINCVNNLKQISLGLRIYSSDHDDNLPPAATWCDAIRNEIGGNTRVFKCPGDMNGQRSSYAFNAKLNGLNVGKIDPQTVMLFECRGGWNMSGGPNDIVTHHGNTYTVAMVDGSVQQVSAARLKSLRWDP
jgi:prepilin-type processing-associated H-X9-DG protein